MVDNHPVGGRMNHAMSMAYGKIPTAILPLWLLPGLPTGCMVAVGQGCRPGSQRYCLKQFTLIARKNSTLSLRAVSVMDSYGFCK